MFKSLLPKTNFPANYRQTNELAGKFIL